MPNGHGLRSRCRDLVSKGYRQNGAVPLTDLLRVFKMGDYVDIKINSAVHAGMPHKWYHGKTGIIWNITPRAVGVEVNKQVRPCAIFLLPASRRQPSAAGAGCACASVAARGPGAPCAGCCAACSCPGWVRARDLSSALRSGGLTLGFTGRGDDAAAGRAVSSLAALHRKI